MAFKLSLQTHTIRASKSVHFFVSTYVSALCSFLGS